MVLIKMASMEILHMEMIFAILMDTDDYHSDAYNDYGGGGVLVWFILRIYR